jgi:hypothetical protein
MYINGYPLNTEKIRPHIVISVYCGVSAYCGV